MRNVVAVAANTFREAVRDRVLYNLVFFALLMMVAAIFVGQISIGIEQSIIVSLGLTAISVIGLFISVFIGVGLVSKEMDKRTLYALLAKPVERWQFLLGKYLGLVMTLTVNTAAMIVAFLAVLEMVKLQAVALVQEKQFGDILVRKHKMFDLVFDESGGIKLIDEEYK